MGDIDLEVPEDIPQPTIAAQQESSFFSNPTTTSVDEIDFIITKEGTKYHWCLCCHVPELAHNFVKFLLFGYNIFFWMISILLIILGIWAQAKKNELQDVGSAFYTNPAFYFIILGTLMFIIAFAGCIGALRENLYMLRVFGVCMIISVILQILLGIMCYAFSQTASNAMNAFASKAIKNYQDDIDLKNTIDTIQQTFECCGGSGYRDWENNEYFSCDSIAVSKCSVPFSCCRGLKSDQVDTQCGFGYMSPDYFDLEANKKIYTHGCTPIVMTYLNEQMLTVLLVVIIIMIPQFFGIFASFLFANQVFDEEVFWKDLQRQKDEARRAGLYRKY